RQARRQCLERLLLNRQLLAQIFILREQRLGGDLSLRIFNFGFCQRTISLRLRDRSRDDAPENYQKNSQLLRDLRRVRTVFLKDSRGRKLAELMTDHVLGDENGVKNLSVVYQERVADKVRRYHRTSRPGFDRLFR